MNSNIDIDADEINDLVILNGFQDNKNKEIEYFITTYNSTNDEKFNTKLLNYFTLFVNGEFNIEDTQTFLEYFYNNAIEQKFFDEWIKYMDKNYNSESGYKIFLTILKTINKTATKLCSHEYVEVRTEKINAIIYILTGKLWSYNYFRNLIKYAPLLNNGKEYMTESIFCTYFINQVYLDNFDTIIETLKPLLIDTKTHEYLIKYLWNILNVNIAHTSNNNSMIKEKKCSTLDVLCIIFKMIQVIVNFYGLDSITNEIILEKKYQIKNYEIQSLPFFHQLYVLSIFSIAVCHNTLYKYYHIYKQEAEYPLTMIFGGSNLGKIKFNIVKSMIEKQDDFSQQIYEKYKVICDYIVMEEIFNDMLVCIDFMTSILPKDNKLKSYMYKINMEIIGGFNKNIKNKHIRYYAVDIMLNLVPYTGYLVFGTLTEIIENMCNYLSQVDFFKWSQLDTAIKHFDIIQQLFIMLLDNYKSVNINDILDNNMSNSLFNIMINSIDMYSHIDTYMNSVLIKFPHYRQHLPIEIKEFCLELLNPIICTSNIIKQVYEKKLLINKHTDLDRELAIFIINNLERLTNTANIIYTVIKIPIVAKDILNLTFEILNLTLSNDIMPYLLDHNKLILDTLSSINISEEQKEHVKHFINSYAVEEIEYPQEFLDPLTCTPIIEPVLLPKIKDFHDKTSILMHLHHSLNNPYTKEQLTEEILMEHNALPEIKYLLEQFMEKKNKWLKDNKK